MLNVYIIDDEPPAIGTIKALLKKNANNYTISVLGSSTDPAKGIKEVNALQPNVLFLDIEMPQCTGFDVINQLDYFPVLTVFITAYENYAVKAFQFDAFQYLVKPLSPAAFSKCLEKVHHQLSLLEIDNDQEKSVINSVTIKAHGGYEIINYEDIEFIEASGAYSVFNLTDGHKKIISKNIKFCVSILNPNVFRRISRSKIVNTNYISSFSLSVGGHVLLNSTQEHLIGRTYQSEVYSYLKDRFVKGR
jgi:two-component system LytT family response regulator